MATTKQGITTLSSPHSAKHCIDKIEHILLTKGFKIFARIDQQSIALDLDMQLPETEVLIFGNPKVGTQLMIDYPSIAIELPLKVVAQQKDNGTSSISFNSPKYIKQRHQVTEDIFSGIENLIQNSII